MTRMLEIPADRPRRSKLLLPLVAIVIALFFISLQPENRGTADRGWAAEAPDDGDLPKR